MNCFNLFFLLLQKILPSILMVWLSICWWFRKFLRLILLLQVDLEGRNLICEFSEFSLHFWVLCESAGIVELLHCWLDFLSFFLQLFEFNFEGRLIDCHFWLSLFFNWWFFVWFLIFLLRKRAFFTKKELHDYRPKKAEKNDTDFVHLHYA